MSECHINGYRPIRVTTTFGNLWINEMGPLNFQFCSLHNGTQVGSDPKTDKQLHRNLKHSGC
jgi:hypothetical protein